MTDKPETLDEMYKLYIAGGVMRRDMFRAVIDKINELEAQLPHLVTMTDGPTVNLDIAPMTGVFIPRVGDQIRKRKRKPGRPPKKPEPLDDYMPNSEFR